MFQQFVCRTMVSVVTTCIGFISSLICFMFGGMIVSFNVYAVPLKVIFGLSQTEVELMGSVTVAGVSLTFIGSICYYKFGDRVVYILGLSLVNSSCIFMWLCVKHADFFKNWIGLLCILLFLNSSGMAITRNTCMVNGVLHFPKRRGVVISIYLSFSAVGKMYYSAIYQIFFKKDNDLGGYFLAVGGGVSVATVICFFFHRTPLDNSSETIPLQDSLGTSETTVTDDNRAGLPESVTWAKKEIIKSSFFHLVQWPNVFVCGCAVIFINNLTILSTSVSIEPRELPLYVLACGILISRILSGFIYDYFGTVRSGLVLLCFSYFAFIASMLLGMFHLTAATLYIMTVLTSITVGIIYSQHLVTVTSVYGSNSLFFLSTLFELANSVFLVTTEVLVGIIYDSTQRQTSLASPIACKECFYWVFVLLFFISLSSTIVIIIAILLVGKDYHFNTI